MSTPATRAEALATLRRTLSAFNGEATRGVGVRMVARLTPAEMTDALNALAVLERETGAEQ